MATTSFFSGGFGSDPTPSVAELLAEVNLELDTHVANTSNPHGTTKAQVGLGNADNTSDVNKPVSTAQQAALNLKANLESPTFTGTVGGITKGMVGLGSVDNTSDAAKPVSTAQQSALDLKANLASPTFTGTVGGITKTMVGLGNVDNTSDANKPVSTAQQTALDAKANLAGSASQNFAANNLAVSSVNGGQLAGMRNKIINGKMEIAQRGTSFSAAAAGTYAVDRFQWGNSSSAVVTLTQQADAPSSNEFQFSARVAVTTADTTIAAADNTGLVQYVEGYNARDLIGRAFTLSFWVRSSKTGIHCVAFRNSGADRSYVAEYTVNAANTWEQKSITVSGGLITAGTWNWTNGRGVSIQWVLASGSDFQTTAGAWNTGNFVATANQVNCLDTIDNIFAITGVQLEVGSVATPFEHRPYGLELALCQRYYETKNGGAYYTAAGANGAGGSTVTFAAEKRAVPTITTITTPVATNGSPSAPSNITTSGFLYEVTASAGGNVRVVRTYGIDAEL